MEPPQKSVHIKTFGCQMNVYDSDRIRSLFEAKGYRFEADVRKANVILVNTCSIRDKAEHKVLSLLGQLRPLKEANPNAVLGVGGCVGQRLGDTLLQKVHHLDIVFGPDGLDRVPDMVEAALAGKRRKTDTQFDPHTRAYSQPAVITRAKPSEFLTIVKGCDHFCTYCIVPYVRGREKSRTIAEVLDDVKRLVEHGTKEVTFLGQNINTYGKGSPERLSQLIEETAKIDGLERIRYVTSHPRDLGDDLIEQFATVPKLMPALHLPFQSGSNRVLEKMKRLYSREEYLGRIEKLRQVRPDIALSTDVIVGFPGETEEEFQETLDVLNGVGFSAAFLFKYSPRPGTKAMELQGDAIAESVKEDRLLRAQQAALPRIDVENATYLGKTIPVLIENLDKAGVNPAGRSPHNKLVHVQNGGPACVGKILDVEITETSGSNLRGWYVGAPRESRQQSRSESPVSASA